MYKIWLPQAQYDQNINMVETPIFSPGVSQVSFKMFFSHLHGDAFGLTIDPFFTFRRVTSRDAWLAT